MKTFVAVLSCLVACAISEPTGEEECKNRFTDHYCQGNVNRCTSSLLFKKYCSKTCGDCSETTTHRPVTSTVTSKRSTTTRRLITTTLKSETTTQRPITATITTKRSTTTQRPVTTTPKSDCKDKRTDGRCSRWKVICFSDRYVREQCKATCNLC